MDLNPGSFEVVLCSGMVLGIKPRVFFYCKQVLYHYFIYSQSLSLDLQS
jgi:hypothetical protein